MASSHGSFTVSGSAIQLSGTSVPFLRGVYVKAAAANAGKVYVGLSSAVTANSASSTDGYELSAGQEFLVPAAAADDLTEVYVIASQASQKIFWFTI